VLAASIIRAVVVMIEAASTSETWGNFYQTTWRNNLGENTSSLKLCPTNLAQAKYADLLNKFFPKRKQL
jgi:hypothetical protein